MRKILSVLICLSFVGPIFSQSGRGDVRGDRIIANQSIFLRDRWIDSVKNDTTGISNAFRSIMTAKAIYDLVIGRTANIGNNHGDSLKKAIDSLTLSHLPWLIGLEQSTLKKSDSTAMSGYATQFDIKDFINHLTLSKDIADSMNVLWQRFLDFVDADSNKLLTGPGLNIYTSIEGKDSMAIDPDMWLRLDSFYDKLDSALANIDIGDISDTLTVHKNWLIALQAAKQAALVSGTNIKTINGNSVLGSGDITISGEGLSDGDKGDVTVSESGSTITIDNGAVTGAKIASATIDSTNIKNGIIPNSKIFSLAYSKLYGTPTTLAGYGITDAAALSHNHSAADINAGTLPVGRGGTGQTSFSTGIQKWTGSAFTAATAGTDYENPLTFQAKNFNRSTNAVSLKTTPTALTDASTTSWDLDNGRTATHTASGNRTLSITNMANGDYVTYVLTQDGAGGRVTTLPGGATTLSGQAGGTSQTYIGLYVGSAWQWRYGATLTGYLLASNNLSDLGSAATARTNLGLAIGSDVQAYSSALASIAGLSPSNDDIIQRKSGSWTNRTMAQLTADLITFTSSTKGVVPASGGGTSNYLRADGTWANPLTSNYYATGTYSATITPSSNISIDDDVDFIYTVQNNIVTITGGFGYTKTGTTDLAQITISLPASYSPDFSSSHQITGEGAQLLPDGNQVLAVYIHANTTDDVPVVTFQPGDAGWVNFRLTFIKPLL